VLSEGIRKTRGHQFWCGIGPESRERIKLVQLQNESTLALISKLKTKHYFSYAVNTHLISCLLLYRIEQQSQQLCRWRTTGWVTLLLNGSVSWNLGVASVCKSEKQKNYLVLKSFELIMIKLPKVSPFSKLRNPSMVTIWLLSAAGVKQPSFGETLSCKYIPLYNPPINFCGISLDKTDHMLQIGRWLSEDIRRSIWCLSSHFCRRKKTEKRANVQAKLLLGHGKQK